MGLITAMVLVFTASCGGELEGWEEEGERSVSATTGSYDRDCLWEAQYPHCYYPAPFPASLVQLGNTPHWVVHPRYYMTRYPDLQRAYGTDYGKLCRHVQTSGADEGRQVSPVFHTGYYLEFNNNLPAAQAGDRWRGLVHWYTSGAKEGRRGSQNFWSKRYLELHKTVRDKCGAKGYLCAIKDYITVGRCIGRRGI